MSLLGLDVGTSACKAATFDERGNLLAAASQEYAGTSPRPGRREMDPETMWRTAAETVRRAAAQTPEPVTALAVSSQGETFIPVDAGGRPVGPAVLNVDNRAVEEVQFLEESLGTQGVHAITGCVLHPMYALPKILWLKRNDRAVYDRTATFLSAGDWVLACLGLRPVTDYSLASRTMAFDVNRHEWSEQVLAAAGIDAARLPEARQAGTKAGELSRSVADSLGLSAGTVVAVGGHDQPCGALGAGVVDPGDTADSAGTYECLTTASDAPALDPEALSCSLNSYCHVVPDRYVTLAFFPGGIVLRWFRDQFGQTEVEEARLAGGDAYDLLISKLPDGPSGICFTPHFLGSGNPTWDVRATGAVVGLRPDRTRLHLFKAILEGIACELRTNVGVLERIVGPIDILSTFGGGARSDYWLQLRADLTGRKVASLRTPEAVCLGAAILAGAAAGVYADACDGARRVAAFARVFEPDDGRAAEYAEQIARYEKLYPALAGAGVF